MNECLHGGGTAQTPPGQEFDRGGKGGSNEKELRKTKGPVI